MSINLKKSVLFRSRKTSLYGFNLTALIKDVLINEGALPEPETCCSGDKDLYIKNGFVGNGTTNLRYEIIRILIDLGVITPLSVSISTCCPDKYNISGIAFSKTKALDTVALKNEVKRVLSFFTIDFVDECCIAYTTELEMLTFLDTNTPGYPVGVFNVDGDFVGIANDQDEYLTVWNSDLSNQAEGTLIAGTSQFKFKLPNTTTQTEVIGLRYYEYTGPANMQIFVGDNDIVHYGSTIKKGNVDGVSITNTTRREWNRNLFGSGGYKSTVVADTVRTLTCTGYVALAPMQVFHNEDSEYAAVSFSFGFYTVAGNFPQALRAVFWAGRMATNYNAILNWTELTNLYSWYSLSAGGTPWGITIANMPTELKSLTSVTDGITQLGLGELTASPGPLGTDYSFVTATNYPILADLVILYNTGEALTGSEAWFLTMPKVTNYLRYSTQTLTQVAAAVADAIWNNIGTALTGVVPVGPAKELRVQRTNNITAASLTARNALISAGWSVLTN